MIDSFALITIDKKFQNKILEYWHFNFLQQILKITNTQAIRRLAKDKKRWENLINENTDLNSLFYFILPYCR